MSLSYQRMYAIRRYARLVANRAAGRCSWPRDAEENEYALHLWENHPFTFEPVDW